MVLPWLGESRQFHCDAEPGDDRHGWKGCRNMRDAATRRAMHCPDFDPKTWPETRDGRDEFGGMRYPDGAPCPGACMRRPVVIETAAAFSVFEKGQLGAYWPDAPAAIWDGVLILSRAFGAQMREQTEAAKKG